MVYNVLEKTCLYFSLNRFIHKKEMRFFISILFGVFLFILASEISILNININKKFSFCVKCKINIFTCTYIYLSSSIFKELLRICGRFRCQRIRDAIMCIFQDIVTFSDNITSHRTKS